MKRFFNGHSLFILCSMIVLASCSKNGGYGNTTSNGNNNNNNSTAPAAVLISLKASPTLGNYLVDKDGRTLYIFGKDADGQNHCTGDCLAAFPLFNLESIKAENLGAGLNLADFGHFTNSAGRGQVTYKGWPLYYYAPLSNGSNDPEPAGQTSGDGVGGIWFVAKPDYTIMIVDDQLLGHDGKDYKSDYSQGTEVTRYFTDGKGVTLYTFTADRANKNNWTKSDFSNNAIWPIYETDQVVVPSTLDKSKFGSIDVFGRKQLTYNGWPLYYFGQDGGVRGFNKGISFPSPGIWHVPIKDINAAP